mgnify:CR=1 FL=1
MPVAGTATERIDRPSFCAKMKGCSPSAISASHRIVPGGMIWPFKLAVIGPGAAIAASELPSRVFVPAPSAAVVAIRMSPAASRVDGMLVRFFSSAAGETAVPSVPATVHAVDLMRSICTGTPAAKNVVVTQAEIRILRITAKRVASAHRNWNISLFAASAAGRMPVSPP